MNMKEMQDKAQRKQVWNTGFPDIAAPSRVLSSNFFFELVELTDRIPLFICGENHYLSDLWPAFGCFIIRFIISVGSDSINVLLNPAGNDFEFSHSIHWSDILISYQWCGTKSYHPTINCIKTITYRRTCFTFITRLTEFSTCNGFRLMNYKL